MHRVLLHVAEVDGSDAGWVLLHIDRANKEPFLILADRARVELATERCEPTNPYERADQGTERAHDRCGWLAELLLLIARLPWMVPRMNEQAGDRQRPLRCAGTDETSRSADVAR